MGCDIHMVVQVRDGDGWRTVKWPDGWYDSFNWEGELVTKRAYRSRNYDLFGMLADVRNGTWGEPTPYIHEPKGFPPDFKLGGPGEDGDEGPDCHEGIWMGDHSYTWLTVAELEAFDWQQTADLSAMVSPEEVKRMAACGATRPDCYCQSTSSSLYTRVEWKETLAQRAGDFYTEWLPRMQLLGKPEGVRIVMGFDN